MRSRKRKSVGKLGKQPYQGRTKGAKAWRGPCVKELVAILVLVGGGRTFKKWGLVGHCGHALERCGWPWSLPSSLHAPPPWGEHSVGWSLPTRHLKAMGPTNLRNASSKIVSQNQPSLFVSWFPWAFGYSLRKLTNTRTKCCLLRARHSQEEVAGNQVRTIGEVLSRKAFSVMVKSLSF
jgi:hypothetical protein